MYPNMYNSIFTNFLGENRISCFVVVSYVVKVNFILKQSTNNQNKNAKIPGKSKRSWHFCFWSKWRVNEAETINNCLWRQDRAKQGAEGERDERHFITQILGYSQFFQNYHVGLYHRCFRSSFAL